MSKRTRNLYAWKAIDDDGRRRLVNAQLFGHTWRFSSKYKDEEFWVTHEPPSLEDVVDLEEMVFNKYQRKHAAWDHVLLVRKLLATLKGE